MSYAHLKASQIPWLILLDFCCSNVCILGVCSFVILYMTLWKVLQDVTLLREVRRATRLHFRQPFRGCSVYYSFHVCWRRRSLNFDLNFLMTITSGYFRFIPSFFGGFLLAFHFSRFCIAFSVLLTLLFLSSFLFRFRHHSGIHITRARSSCWSSSSRSGWSVFIISIYHVYFQIFLFNGVEVAKLFVFFIAVRSVSFLSFSCTLPRR